MDVNFASRTKQFALRVLKVADSLPKTPSGWALSKQIARSGTAVAANFRSAFRAQSGAHFVSKMSVAVEESDETLFWLELIEEHGALSAEKLTSLKREADEITAVLVASLKTAKARTR